MNEKGLAHGGGLLRLKKKTDTCTEHHNELLHFHDSSGYANASQRYVLRKLPVLFLFLLVVYCLCN